MISELLLVPLGARRNRHVIKGYVCVCTCLYVCMYVCMYIHRRKKKTTLLSLYNIKVIVFFFLLCIPHSTLMCWALYYGKIKAQISYVCMYVCMYVCVYVCMYVWITSYLAFNLQSASRGFIKFTCMCRRSVGFFSWAFLVFLMKESKKRRRKQPGKLMVQSFSQPVNRELKQSRRWQGGRRPEVTWKAVRKHDLRISSSTSRQWCQKE